MRSTILDRGRKIMRKYILLAVAPLVIGAVAIASKPETVFLCHKTSSETNPWVVQEVSANEEQSHLDNGDKLYQGPLKDNGHPLNDDWCNKREEPSPTPNPQPNPAPTPTPVPTPSPSPVPSPTVTSLPTVGAHGDTRE